MAPRAPRRRTFKAVYPSPSGGAAFRPAFLKGPNSIPVRQRVATVIFRGLMLFVACVQHRDTVATCRATVVNPGAVTYGDNDDAGGTPPLDGWWLLSSSSPQ